MSLPLVLAALLAAAGAVDTILPIELEDDSVVTEFGFSVAVGGDAAAVGNADGSCSVIRRSGPEWELEQTLSRGPVDYGNAVAVDGDRLLVAESSSTVSGVDRAGAAFVYERAAGAWTQTEVLTAAESELVVRLGTAVALEGDTAILATPDYVSPDFRGGFVVFNHDNGWEQEGDWIEGPTTSSGFGAVISLSEGRLLVGARFDNTRGTNAGEAYLMERVSPGEWNTTALPVPVDRPSQFGASVALHGPRALVDLVMFAEEDGEWSVEAVLEVPDLDTNFPTMALGDSIAVVAAYAERDIHVFLLVEGLWERQPIASSKADTGLYGLALALDKPWLVAGDKDNNVAHLGVAVPLPLEASVAGTVQLSPYVDGISRATAPLTVSLVGGVDPVVGTSLTAAVANTTSTTAPILRGTLETPAAFDTGSASFGLVAVSADVGSTVSLEIYSQSVITAALDVEIEILPCTSAAQDPLLVADSDDPVRCVCAPGAQLLPSLLCGLCDRGSFKSEPGNGGCSVCPVIGQTTPGEGSTTADDCLCADGLVLIDGECDQCPTGAVCIGGEVIARAPLQVEADEDAAAPQMPVIGGGVIQMRGIIEVHSDLASAGNKVRVEALSIDQVETDSIGTVGLTTAVFDDTGTASLTGFGLLAPAGRQSTLKFVAIGAPASPGFLNVSVAVCEDVPEAHLGSVPPELTQCACAPGFSLSSGNTCAPCPRDSYKSVISNTACTACPGFLVTFDVGATSVDQCLCPDGLYLNAQGDCEECPEGAVCSGNEISAARSHFLLFDDEGELFIYDCPVKCAGDNMCTAGYSGILCQECADGYGPVGEYCVPCPAEAVNVTLIVLSIVLGAVVLAALVKSASNPGTVASALTKSLTTHLQILALVSGSFSTQWPSIVTGALGVSGALVPTSQNMSFECALRSSLYTRTAAAMLLPVVVCAVAGLALLVHPGARNKIASSTLFFLFFFHPTVVSSTVSVLPCRDFGPEGSRLANDVTLECGSGMHVLFSAVAIIHLAVYGFGLLAGVARFLSRHRAEADSLLFLTDGYRTEGPSIYWELVSQGRTIALIATAAVTSGAIQLFVGLIVFLAVTEAQSIVRPHRSHAVGALNSLSAFVLAASLASSIAFRGDGSASHAEDAIAFLVVLVNIAYLVFLGSWITRAHLDQRGAKLDEVGEDVFSL